MVTFQEIGNFLAYAIKNIQQFGKEENLIIMQSNLENLFTANGIDQLKLSILLGMNTYSNLDLLQSFESNDMMLGLKKCHGDLDTESNLLKEVLMDREEILEKGVYLKPSPCLNITKNPACKTYCEWHQNAVGTNSLLKSRNLLM